MPENSIIQGAYLEKPDIGGVRFLLDHGASGRDESLLDPIIVGGGNEKLLEFLLQNGANPKVKDSNGTTPLMVSAHY